jgi:hypothetical protein
MKNTIHLKGMGRHEERVSAGVLSPGHLLVVNSTDKVVVHATEGGVAERLFAKEDALQGKTVSQAYASGDVVSILVAAPGDEVQAILKAGEDVDIGDILISAGDGTLIEEGSEGSGVVVKQRVAVAIEAVDLSGSGAVNTFIAVRVL